MKTPSNKTQIKSKSKSKNNKKHQVIVYVLRSIPKPIRFILIAIVIFLIYGAIHNWSTQQIAASYLRNKYNKEFNLRWDNSAPNWIGKPPTYHGLAKVKDGSDDVEFEVICEIDDRRCSDFYLERSWARSEERSIRKYLADILPQSVEIKVGITSKVEQLDDSLQVASFEHYLKKHSTKLVDSYQVMFLDKTRSTNIQLGKQIIGKTSDYIKNKVGTGGIHYAIYNGSEKECISNYDTHNKDKTVNNEINFENAPGVKGEEKCR